jgi:hypothetical protein
VRALRDSTSWLHRPRGLRRRFRSDGYLFARGIVDRQRVDQLAVDVTDVLRELELLEGGDQALARFRATRSSFYRGLQRLESFHALASDPGLVGLVRVLVGDDAFAHPQRLLRAILPGIEELVTPPHQDYAYIRGTERTVTAWLPLKTCRVADGALRVLVGSHRRGPLPLLASPAVAGSRVDVDDADPDWASADLDPGDVLIFHSLTVHGAQPNTSASIRLSADYRFQSASDPVAERSLRPSGYPEVPDWPELLAGVSWDESRWLAVPEGVEIVAFDPATPTS